MVKLVDVGLKRAEGGVERRERRGRAPRGDVPHLLHGRRAQPVRQGDRAGGEQREEGEAPHSPEESEEEEEQHGERRPPA